MKITFYGVRGSIPSPGYDTYRYGGNTSCVHIETASGQDLVLDAGTGIRNLGKRLIEKDSPINIFLSHGHWDHIQGYPFFMPIYQPDRQIRVYTIAADGHEQICALFDQIDGANFPVKATELPSQSECITGTSRPNCPVWTFPSGVYQSTIQEAATPIASRKMVHPVLILLTMNLIHPRRYQQPMING
jgi:phosphoribosyl 1,2-cyclic phosphodiesterase